MTDLDKITIMQTILLGGPSYEVFIRYTIGSIEDITEKVKIKVENSYKNLCKTFWVMKIAKIEEGKKYRVKGGLPFWKMYRDQHTVDIYLYRVTRMGKADFSYIFTNKLYRIKC